MDKFLYFADGADDAACWPLSSLIEMSCASNATLLMRFKGLASGTGDDEGNSLVTLTITADKEKDVLAGIVAKINAHPNGDPFIVVADNVNSVYAHADITGSAITLDS